MVGVGAYDECLALSLIRGADARSKSLVGGLETRRLVTHNQPRRGRFGSPLLSYSLSPDETYSLALKIGRRRLALVLANCSGSMVSAFRDVYDYATPHRLMRFLRASLADLSAHIPKHLFAKIVGSGAAMPASCGTGIRKRTRRRGNWTSGA
jgi:hypothetical protein